MAEALKYTSSLTGQEIDAALLIAKAIGMNRGIPLSLGSNTLRMVDVIQKITGATDDIPTAAAVLGAICANIRMFSVVALKGSVPDFDSLPASPATGDAYILSESRRLYAWSGDYWVDCGPVISSVIVSINGIVADAANNVTLTAENILTVNGVNIQTALDKLTEEKQSKVTASGLLKGDGIGGVAPAAPGVDYQAPAASATVQLAADSWNEKTQSVTVAGVTENNAVIVSPAPDSFSAYGEAKCRCISQVDDQLVFACDDLPESDLSVNVLII